MPVNIVQPATLSLAALGSQIVAAWRRMTSIAAVRRKGGAIGKLANRAQLARTRRLVGFMLMVCRGIHALRVLLGRRPRKERQSARRA